MALVSVALVVKNLPANSGDIRDIGLIPGSGRSLGGGHGNTLQYTYLENTPVSLTCSPQEPDGLQFIGSQRVGHD